MEQIVIQVKNQALHKAAGILAALGTLLYLWQIFSANYWAGFSDFIALLMCVGGTICFFIEPRLDHPKAGMMPVVVVFAGAEFIWFMDLFYYLFNGHSITVVRQCLLVSIFVFLILYALDRVPAIVPALIAVLYTAGSFLIFAAMTLPGGYISFGALFMGNLHEFLLITSVVVGLYSLEREHVQVPDWAQSLSSGTQSVDFRPQPEGPSRDYRTEELSREADVLLSILLCFLTAGIYMIFWVYSIAYKIKLACGEKPSAGWELFCIFCIPFYEVYWLVTRSRKLAEAAPEYGVEIDRHGVLYFFLSLLALDFIVYGMIQSDLNKISQSVSRM